MQPVGNNIPAATLNQASANQSNWNIANTMRTVRVITAETAAWGTLANVFAQGIHYAVNDATAPGVHHVYIGACLLIPYLKALQYYHTGKVTFTFPKPF